MIGMNDVADILRRAHSNIDWGASQTTAEPQGTGLSQSDIEELIQQRGGLVPNEVQSEQEIPLGVAQAMEENFSPEFVEHEERLEDVVTRSEQDEQVDYSNVLVHEETARFSSAEWFEKAKSMLVTIAGIGGIGRIV